MEKSPSGGCIPDAEVFATEVMFGVGMFDSVVMFISKEECDCLSVNVFVISCGG